MRSRFWLFCLVIAAALAANLAVASSRFAHNAEDGLGSRLTVASAALRTQIELLDLRTSPRIAAFSPELIEATRPVGDASQQPARPDERALRAAAAALQPDPDLIVVSTAHSAAVSRRGKAASLGEEPARLPLLRIALESGAPPQFVAFEGKLYRAAAARIPGNAAVVLTGTLVDDRFAAQLRSAVDAEVSFVQQGALVASSLPAEERAAVAAWAKAPAGSGFGTVRVSLPLVGARFADRLPLGAPRAATRAVPVALAQGTLAVVSVAAAPQLAWLARYQAFYIAAWALFILAALVWGVFLGPTPRVHSEARPEPARARRRAEPEEAPAQREAEPTGADVSAAGETGSATPARSQKPWNDEPASARVRAAAAHEALDPDLPPRPAREDEPQLGPLTAAAGTDPMWSGDPFGPPGSVQGPDPASGEMELGGPPPAPAAGGDARRSAASPGLGEGWSEPAPGDGGPAPGGWGPADPGAAEPWPPPQPTPAAKPAARPPANAPASAKPATAAQKDVTLADFTLPAGEGSDPDEAHFRETFDKFMALRAETGESGTLSYEKFAAKLRQNREQLLSRGTARSVRFTVYKKDGRAAIKASAVR
jgi:hypothetical protein